MKLYFTFLVVLSFLLTPQLRAQGAGNAIQFNSALNQYVNVPYTPGLRPANTVTLEAWINTNWQTIGQVAMVGNTEIGGYEFDVNYVNAAYAIMFEVHRNGSYGNPSIPCNTLSAGWHHFAGTYDGRYAKLYVDGALVATNDAGATFPIHYSSFNNDLIMGAEAYSGSTPAGSYFTGQLDEIRIWDNVRSQAQIQSTMNAELTPPLTGLLACYHMNESAGAVVLADAAENHYNGTIHGATMVASSAPLPVELTSFSASTKENVVTLEWKTATEINNCGFSVERGSQNTWYTVGFVSGNGTTNEPHTYTFTDAGVTGRTSYRLKQIDADGKFVYSKPLEVVPDVSRQILSLRQNYPNPFNPSTTISFYLPMTSFVTVKVYDLLGNDIATPVSGMKEPGLHTVSFDASKLSSGIYICRLRAGQYTESKRMIVAK